MYPIPRAIIYKTNVSKYLYDLRKLHIPTYYTYLNITYYTYLNTLGKIYYEFFLQW